MDAIQSTMTNEELGSWWRKAIRDVRSGCRSNDVDDFIKEQYKVTESRMQKRQQTNQAYYNKHNDQVTVPSASVNANGSQQEAANGNTADDCKAQPSCTNFADGDTREGSLNIANTGNRAHLESGTSAKTSGSKVDAPTGNAGENNHSPQGSILESATSTAVAKPLKKPYGENKHVLLTDEEGAKLRELYGHDLAVAINILDGYIENNGKAAKRYKSHYMVLRRGNWVWDKVQNMKLTEKRLENAGGKAKNFKAEEREAMARFIRGESVNHDSKVNDSELSMEELKQLYG
ncbi:MAG: hypothetical protein MJZ25_05245 [Fibrobacter sp.]|nr:hypothetical protein [Fibrobacter sp.]